MNIYCMAVQERYGNLPARSSAVTQRAYSLSTGNDETIFFVEADTCDVTRLWNNVVSFCYEIFVSVTIACAGTW